MTTDRAGQPANSHEMWVLPAAGPADHERRRRREQERLEAQLLVSGQRAQQARRQNLAGPTNPRAHQRFRRQLEQLQTLEEALEEGPPTPPQQSAQPAQPSRPQQQQQQQNSAAELAQPQQQQAPLPQPAQQPQPRPPQQPPRSPSPTTTHQVTSVTLSTPPAAALLRAEGIDARDFAVELEEKKAAEQKREVATIAAELARQGVDVRDWAYPSVEMRGVAIGVVVGEGAYVFGGDSEEEEGEEMEGEEGEEEKVEEQEGEKMVGDGVCSSSVEGEAQTEGADLGVVVGEGERLALVEVGVETESEPQVEADIADETA